MSTDRFFGEWSLRPRAQNAIRRREWHKAKSGVLCEVIRYFLAHFALFIRTLRKRFSNASWFCGFRLLMPSSAWNHRSRAKRHAFCLWSAGRPFRLHMITAWNNTDSCSVIMESKGALAIDHSHGAAQKPTACKTPNHLRIHWVVETNARCQDVVDLEWQSWPYFSCFGTKAEARVHGDTRIVRPLPPQANNLLNAYSWWPKGE